MLYRGIFAGNSAAFLPKVGRTIRIIFFGQPAKFVCKGLRAKLGYFFLANCSHTVVSFTAVVWHGHGRACPLFGLCVDRPVPIQAWHRWDAMGGTFVRAFVPDFELRCDGDG
jgi:hypothetical protein